MSVKTQTVRFAVVGTNTITDKFISGASGDGRFSLGAVVSRSRDTGDAFAAKYSISRVFTSAEEMAACPDIDAVYIASPNSCHAEQAMTCMNGGKHVLCEKPIASNARELRAMIGCAGKNGVVLMEAMKPMTSPNFKVVRETVGKIGKPRRYFSSYCQYSSRYDAFKEGRVLNAFRRELSNGALLDIGIYTIYPMVVLFGRPAGIKANGSLMSTGIDAQGTAMFDYGDMEASVAYSKVSDSMLPTEIQGEDGTIILDRIGQIGKVSFRKRGGELRDISAPTPFDDFYYEAGEFIDTILSGRKESAVNSHENSMITMEIMDEIRSQLGIVYPADACII